MKNILLGVVFFLVTILSFGQSFEGFALYNSQGSNTTYLIDENLNIVPTLQEAEDILEMENIERELGF